MIPRPIAMGPGCHRDDPAADRDGARVSSRRSRGRSRWGPGVVALIPRPIAMGPRRHRADPAADRDRPPRTLSYAPPMLVPQLLMLYHQRYNTKTLRVHVEHLRAHGFVWWGRFYGGAERFDATAARARWSHVAELAEGRAKAREPSILFVSNHVELHACKVIEVAFGDDPAGGTRSQALPYYAERSVPLWFRVEDVRALSYDHTMTIDWFEHRLGLVKASVTRWSSNPYERPFDPAGELLHKFPIVLEGPPCAELFAPEGRPRGAGLCAGRRARSLR